MIIDPGKLAAGIGAGFGAAAPFSRTKILSPCCSTRQQETGSRAGGRSAWPVRRLKQA
jgi:hypothetical protein